MSNLRFRTKLICAFCSVLLVLTILSSFAVFALNEIRGDNIYLKESWNPSIITIMTMSAKQSEIIYAISDTLAEIKVADSPASEENENAISNPLAGASAAKISDYEKFIQERQRAIEENCRIYRSILEADEEGQIDGEGIDPEDMALLEAIENGFARLAQLQKQIFSLAYDGQPQTALDLFNGEYKPVYNQLQQAYDDCVALNVDGTNEFVDEIVEKLNLLVKISLIMAVIGLILGILQALLILRSTEAQLGRDPGELADIAQRVVDGDYNIDDGSPKTGIYGAIVTMVNSLKDYIESADRESKNAKEQSVEAHSSMLRAEAASDEAKKKTEVMLAIADKLEQAVNGLSVASTQLVEQIEQSDKGAEEAAQKLAETATAMNEMNSTVREVALNASTASDVSADTREKAQQGARIVEQSLHSIEDVRRISSQLKEDMGQLNEHAQDITRIMNVIADIADQTNLLALNAAIEAARAGEAGRGFAVVADEVRKLAEKTMVSTADVSNVIKAIQTSTEKSMSSVDGAVDQVNKATELAELSGNALNEIVSTVDATVDQVEAIATASEEQSAASDEINQSIIQVNDITRQTAEAMAEASQAVSELAGQVRHLSDIIYELKNA